MRDVEKYLAAGTRRIIDAETSETGESVLSLTVDELGDLYKAVLKLQGHKSIVARVDFETAANLVETAYIFGLEAGYRRGQSDKTKNII